MQAERSIDITAANHGIAKGLSTTSSVVSRQSLIALAMLLLLGLIWGGFPNLGKYVGLAGISPLNYAFQTIAIAAVALLGVNGIRRRRVPLTRRHLGYYLVSGLLSTAVPSTVMFVVVHHVPAGMMSILMALIPLMAYLMAIGLRLERVHLRRALGIITGFCGIVLLVATQSDAAGSSTLSVPVQWLLLGLITPLCYAAGNIFNHLCRPADTESLVAANGMLLGATVALLVVLVAVDDFMPATAYGMQVFSLVILHGVLIALAFAVFFSLLRRTGPVYLSQVAYLVTIFGIGIGMWLFAERFNPWFWLALLVVFLGVMLVNQQPAKRHA